MECDYEPAPGFHYEPPGDAVPNLCDSTVPSGVTECDDGPTLIPIHNQVNIVTTSCSPSIPCDYICPSGETWNVGTGQCESSCVYATGSSCGSCNRDHSDTSGPYNCPGIGFAGWRGHRTCNKIAGPASCSFSIQRNCIACGSSFIAGTLISVPGGEVDIKDINVGDDLVGSDGLNTVIELKRRVHKGKVYSVNGSRYFVTPGHPLSLIHI